MHQSIYGLVGRTWLVWYEVPKPYVNVKCVLSLRLFYTFTHLRDRLNKKEIPKEHQVI